MIGHQLDDYRQIGTRGEKHLLLNLEVIHQFQFVTVLDAPRQQAELFGRGAGGQRTAYEDAQRQAVVVLVRERNQGRIAQHLLLSL